MPLNQNLYQNMLRVFGEIEIKHEGECASTPVKITRTGRFIDRCGTSLGEYYAVNCPFCADTRRRLYINYQFYGQPWLACCYNETACLTGAEGKTNRQQLQLLLRPIPGDRTKVTSGVTLPSRLPQESFRSAENGKQIELPGHVIPIMELPQNHPAVTYLISRGYDIATLWREYNVGYVISASRKYLTTSNRIYIPYYTNRYLVGWQCRYVGECDWKYEGIIKYYTMPGFHRSQSLYGCDAAFGRTAVVLVEGASDVWRLGPGSVALLGSSLSQTQANILISNWKTIFVYLDSDTWQAQDSNHESPLRRLLNRLIPMASANGNRVISVPMPQNVKDPAQMSREKNWGWLAHVEQNTRREN